MTGGWRVALGVGLLISLGLVCALRWSVNTSMMHFVGADSDRRLARVSTLLAESELTRSMVFLLSGSSPEQAQAAALELGARLRQHPEVAWVRDRLDPELEEAVAELYLPRRFLLLSERPEAEVAELFSDEALAAAAEALKHQLAVPGGGPVRSLAARDPLLLFARRAQGLKDDGGVTVADGVFVTGDGRAAVVFAATRSSPFDGAVQRPLEEHIRGAIQRLSERGIRVQRSSVHRFALQSEASIRADVQRISVLSLVGILALFGLAYRSPALLVPAVVPVAVGVLAGLASVLLLFGQIHGLTLAFGATLLGVCLDYPIHFFTHHRLAPHPAGVDATLRRVWPGILLGGLTTAAGFAALTWTSFAGLREIGLFSAVGVLAALLATRHLVPPLLVLGPFRIRAGASGSGGFGALLDSPRAALLLLPTLALVLCAVGLPKLRWIDDARALNRLDPQLLAEDNEVRRRVSRAESSRLVLAHGDNLEQALQRNDEVFGALRDLAATDGTLAFRSLHRFLWSEDLQSRNLAALEAQPEVATRTLDALQAAGFRRAAFAPFVDDLAAQPPPLRLADLRSSPLAPVVEPFVLEVEEGWTLLTHLSHVADADALERSLAGIEGVEFFDQHAFLAQLYGSYRARVLRLVLIGLAVILGLVLLRYRSVGLALAAFVPAALAGATTLAVLALLGVEAHLLHLVALLLVLSIGVDYGVFLAEARRGEHAPAALRATLNSLLVACGSTVCAFGLLALSDNPAMRALGWTTGVGVLLSLLLAPTALALLAPPKAPGRSAPESAKPAIFPPS
jgi:predicted exporter